MKRTLLRALCLLGATILSASCSKSDPDIVVTGVSLDHASLILAEEETATLTATVKPADAANLEVTWRTQDATIAVVDRTGLVTAVKAGETFVIVTTVDGGKTATCKLTVTPKYVSVSGVTLNKTTLTVEVGHEETLTATVTPSDATNQKVKWSTGDATIATVDEESGVVKGIAEGKVTITATSEDGSKTATCEVTVDKDITASFDAGFARALQTKGYVKDATKIMKSEVQAVTVLNVAGCSLTSLEGIENFVNIEKLQCYNNLIYPSIDLRQNTKLVYLYAEENRLVNVYVGTNAKLKYLDVSENQLVALNVRNNPELQWLYTEENNLSTLDVTKNTKLQYLDIAANDLTAIDLSKNTELVFLHAFNNEFTSIDLTHNSKVQILYLSNGFLSSIDITHCTELLDFRVNGNRISTIDLSKNTKLRTLYVSDNEFTSLDISNNTQLNYLITTRNQGNADGMFVVTVWKGFVLPSLFNCPEGTTWQHDGKTVTITYKEKGTV